MADSQLSDWFEFALQQLAAESYLDGIDLQDQDRVRARLIDGNNDTRVVIPEESGNMHGKSRFPEFLANQFLSSYLIVDHHANDASGFSSTLFFDNATSTYTLAFRSTEYRNQEFGGDYERDGVGLINSRGADAEIVSFGFALGQLLAMEHYFQEVKAILPSGSRINVTGYSLGGHLATVFTELHDAQVIHTYAFNGVGRGNVSGGGDIEWLEAERIRQMLIRMDEVLSNPIAALPDSQTSDEMLAIFSSAKGLDQSDPEWNPFASGSSQNLYLDPRYLWARYVVDLEFSPTFQLGRIARSDGAFAKITQIYGSANDGDTEYTANSQNHAATTKIYIEDQPNFDGFGGFFDSRGDFGTSHSITLIIDSLALQDLFLSIDPTLTQENIERIFAGSSAQHAQGSVFLDGESEGNSLEYALDALYKVVTGKSNRTPFDRSTGGFGDIGNRTIFYQRMDEIRTASSSLLIPLKIEALLGKSALEMVVEATNPDPTSVRSRAFRYALKELNPFVVLNANYAPHGSLGELDIYVPETSMGQMSMQWIRDRASMLVALNAVRVGNSVNQSGQYTGATGTTVYTSYDAPEGRITIVPTGVAFSSRFVTFDSDEGNSLFGGNQDDRLYGAGGNDVLEGFNGSDWLEGGKDNDELRGGDGDDELYGDEGRDFLYGNDGTDSLDGGGDQDYMEGGQGSDRLFGRGGDDTLDGGKGSDRLAGGEGLDFYVFRSGDGVDTIIDDDGLGHIIIDGRPIVSPAEGFKRIDNVWMSEGLSDPYSFHLDGSMETGGVLTISGLFHGQIRIENFKNGNLGIRLSDQLAKSEPDPPVNIVKVNSHTDLKSIGTDGVDHAVAIEDHSFFLGLGGNDVLGEIGNEAYNGEQLYGNGGNDLIIGSDVDLGGGSGGDFLVGGGGGDSIFGGAGSDALWGEGSAWFTPDAFRVDGFQYSLDGDGEGNGVGYFYNPIYSLVIDGVEFRLGGLSEALHWILGTTGSTDLSECFNDYLDGGDGDDWIYGMAGSDTLYGGDGDDVLVGDVDNPQFIYIGPGTSLQLVNLLGQYGDDYLDGGAGNDKLSDLSAGNDVLIGGEGNDILENIERTPNDAQNANYYAGSLVGDEVFSNYLDGGIGNDSLRSVNHYAGGHDELYGGVGDDKIVAAGIGAQFDIVGGDGDDEITIGAGVFTIVGGNGDDLYHIFGGIGFLSPDKAVIEDEDLAPENEDRIEVILFGSIGDLSLTRKADDLLIGIGGQIDWITVSNWFVGPEHKIEQFGITCIDSNFHPTDMVVWDIAAIERLAAWTGTTGPDVLIGEDGDDTILGNDGDDDIVAGKGNDHITGGSGNDELNGGDGDDTYFFSSGDGIDSIEDSGGFDTLILGEGITPDTVSVGFVDNELKIVSGPDLISLRWLPLLGYQIEQVKFKDGQIWDAAQLAQMAEKENDAPIVDNEITDQDCVEDEQFNFQIPTDAFDDDNGNSDLTLSATLSIGSALPPWLSFNPEFGLFSGMPGNADVGKISIKVVATDAEGASVFDIFDLTVVNANDSPIVLHPIDDQVAVDEMPYNLSIPSDLFEDPDIGDQLMYSISLESGLALPSWLAFDSATRMLSGTPSSLDIGSFSVKVKAIDSTGATASEQFEIVVNPSASLFLVGNATNQRLVGKSGADILDGGAGKDVLVGKRGNDTYFIDNLRDLIVEVAEEGNDLVYSSISYALPQNVENLTLTGPGNNSGTGNSLNNIVKGNSGVNVLKGMAGEDFIEAEGGEDYLYGGNGDDVLDGGAEGDHLYGNAGSDYLQGNVGRDYLYGGPGLDLLQGGGQDDYVYDTDGPGLLDGGDGNDSLTGRKGKNFFVGGVGDDTIATRSRENVIVFNLHDGKDVIAMRLTAQNTLSLGGGVAYVDLAFVKSSWDLVLNISSTDQITFKDWYLRQGNKSVTRLQVIAEAMPGFDHGGSNTLLDNKVEIFDFAALATAFDASGQVNGWALTNALLSAHLMGSDTAAIGGDLAYQYGLNGSLSSVGLTAAQDVLKAPQFGTSAQALRPLQDLQQGQIRLQ